MNEEEYILHENMLLKALCFQLSWELGKIPIHKCDKATVAAQATYDSFLTSRAALLKEDQ